MHLRPSDLRQAHAALGEVDELIDQRRAVYEVTVDVMSESDVRTGSSELDNPIVRGHLGSVLAGVASFEPRALRPLGDLVEENCVSWVEGHPVRLASTAGAAEALAGALGRIGRELQRHGSRSSAALLTSGTPEFAAIRERVRAGVELAVRLAPELVLDLLPHVSLFAVISADASDRLGSASAREYPGLIVIPEPRSSFEVAEALVHEGAHQKFFDLALTRSLLGTRNRPSPLFRPPWADDDAPAWPVEQTYAAFHAYCCLAAFAQVLEGAHDVEVHEYSLVPVAAHRARVIGDWLFEHAGFLGADGHFLLGELTGRPPAEPAEPAEGVTVPDLMSDPGLSAIRSCGSRTLLLRRSQPVELFWLVARGEDSAKTQDER
jgi:hypothetical protein